MTTVTTKAGRGSDARSLPGWLWVAFGGVALLYGVPSVWLLMSFIQQAYDLGIYDQALWLIAHGESFNTVAGTHVVGDHFSPILYVMSPLAFLPGGAVPELVVTAVVIASGVFPAYRLAQWLDRDPRWFVTVYAIHPAMITGSWTGWRPWNLAVPVFMWVCYLVVSRPTVLRITISGLVLLLFREDLAVWVGLLALVVYLARRLSLKDLLMSGLALGAATGIVVFLVLPALSPVEGYFFIGDFYSRAPDAGQVIASVSTRTLFLLLPLGLSPARLDWRLMAPLAIPVVGLVLRGGPSLTTFFQYDMMFVPMLLAVVGLSAPVLPRSRTVIVGSLIALVALGALRPIPPQHGPNPWSYDRALVEEYRLVLGDLREIRGSDSLSVTAPDTLVPHLSERRNVFVYPFPVDRFPDRERFESRLSFQCPPPNVIVERADFLTPQWTSTMTSVGYERVVTRDRVSVWVSVEPMPDKPCSAQYEAPR